MTAKRVALLLESDGPGGAEVVVFQLGEELTRRGHQILFVGPENGRGWLGSRFKEAGMLTTTFTKRHPLDPRWVSELCHTLRQFEIEVVHGHEFAMTVYGTAAARRLGLPVVNTFHGDEGMTKAWRRRSALRWAIPRANACCAVSAATRTQITRDLGLHASQLELVRNGVPVRSGERSKVRTELGIGDGELMVLAVGNLEERKGHLILLQALATLRDQGVPVNWRVVIAGGRGGPMFEPLRQFAIENRFEDRVHILTFRNDIPDLQAAADLFVMPSLWEGLPLATLEAMLAGNAIVASDTAGIPEAITHESEGLLVPPGSIEPLAQALGRLLADGSLRERLGARARERGLAEFTVNVMADRYEALYLGTKSGELPTEVTPSHQ